MDLRRLLPLAALLVGLSARPATADSFKPGPEGKSTFLVADPQASKGEAVAVSVGQPEVLPIAWPRKEKLTPGLYRLIVKLRLPLLGEFDASQLEMHLKLRGTGGELLDLLLNCSVVDGRLGFYTAVTQEFSVTQPVLPVFTFSSSNATGATEHPAPPKKQPKLDELDPEKKEADDLTKDLTTTAGTETLRPLSTLHEAVVLLDTVEIQRLNDSVVIERLWPEKIHVYPGGESNPITVMVRNYQPQPVTATVRLTVRAGLDEANAPLEVALTVPGFGTATQTFAWTSGAREFGHGACAEVIVGGQSVHSRTEYFSVSRPIWKTSLHGDGIIAWSGREKIIPDVVAENRGRYMNVAEDYNWQPAGWADWNPTNADWLTGDRQLHNSLAGLRLWMSLSHSNGIKVISNAGLTASGPAGFEWARRHPDLVKRGNEGLDEQGYDVEHLRQYDLTHSRPELAGFKQTTGESLRPDLTSLTAVEFGANEMIKSAKNFGWDGVRFDSPPGVGIAPDGGHAGPGLFAFDRPAGTGDSVAVSIRNVRYLRHRFESEINSNFAVAYDFALDLNPQTWEPTDPSLAKFQAECSRDGSMIMDEQIRFSTRHTTGSWTSYWQQVSQEAQVARQNGGYHECLAPGGAVYRAYTAIFTFASGSHTYGDFGWSTPSPGKYPAFMTRYGEYCWDLALRPIEADAAGLRIDDGAKLLWKPFIRVRQLPKGVTQTIIHLITPPTNDGIAPTVAVPPAAWSLGVKVHKRGSTPPIVWRLSAEPDVQGEKLAVQAEGDGFTVTVPEQRLWTILVWEENAK